MTSPPPPPVISDTSDGALRRARQAAKTDVLLGVDFLRLPASRPVDSQPKTRSEAARDKAAALMELRKRHDAQCPHCTNATYHTQTVFGEGDPDADLMFIGEAPGAEEDRTGRPFVGRAGQLLDKMIGAMGLSREDVYIANVLKSRPPDNATPTPSEVEKCAPYLAEQIGIIRPKAIVALGSPSAKFLLGTTEGISRLRGIWHTIHVGGIDVEVMPTFHPAYLLRNYTPDTRGKVWSDLQKVMAKLGIEK